MLRRRKWAVSHLNLSVCMCLFIVKYCLCNVCVCVLLFHLCLIEGICCWLETRKPNARINSSNVWRLRTDISWPARGIFQYWLSPLKHSLTCSKNHNCRRYSSDDWRYWWTRLYDVVKSELWTGFITCRQKCKSQSLGKLINYAYFA